MQDFEQLSLFDEIYDEYKITKPVRLISFFSGIEAQFKALSYLGEKLGVPVSSYKTCEWAYNSIVGCNAIHNRDFTDYALDLTKEELISKLNGISINYNEPLSLEQLSKKPLNWLKNAYNNCVANHNLLNIMNVKATDLEIVETDKYDYIVTYSFPCVIAGTKIKTANGYKNIEEIVVGDKVLTHTGKYQNVLKTMDRISNHYYIIKGVGCNLFLTEEHPLYVLRDNKIQWIKVKDLKTTDRISYNINNENKPCLYSNQFLWLLGRYVADGYIGNYNSVCFAIGNKKVKSFEENTPSFEWKTFKKKGSVEYRIADYDLKKICMEFSKGATHKRIPQWVIDLPRKQLNAFFNGYMSGDGHIRERANTTQLMCSTVSKDLYLGLQDIMLKLFNACPSLYIRKDKRKETFNDTYNLQLSLHYKNIWQEKIGNHIFVKLSSIERVEEPIQVYNIEVENDNSYTCDNVIVHNCQDLSLAGKRAGMDTSQSDGGTRSGLLWEVERILGECQELGSMPQILIMENVPQIHSEKDYPNFEKWMTRLQELGYMSYWADLNAKDFGIPQNRERTFMVSVLGSNYHYKFPRPIERKYNLKDMLEDNVDEKYYCSQKMVDYLTGINQKKSKFDRGSRFETGLKTTNESGVALCITTAAGQRATDNFILDEIKVVGNYMPSGHNAGRVVDPTGLAPTVMENHGTVTAVMIRENTEDGYRIAHEGDGINISSRMKHQRGNVQYEMSQTLKTTCEVGTLEINGTGFRIRKLTPKECGRLMAFQDIDTDRMLEAGLGNSAIYHVYGDSLLPTIMLGIFGKLFGLEQTEIKKIIYDYIETIKLKK